MSSTDKWPFWSEILKMFNRFHGIIVDNNFDDISLLLDMVRSCDHNSVIGIIPTYQVDTIFVTKTGFSVHTEN